MNIGVWARVNLKSFDYETAQFLLFLKTYLMDYKSKKKEKTIFSFGTEFLVTKYSLL